MRVSSRFHRRISPPEPSARLPTAEHRSRHRHSWRRCAGDDSWAKPAYVRVWCKSAVAGVVLVGAGDCSCLPMLLRKLSGCVPPMLETKTKRLTPAALAASICILAPSQSTSSGVPAQASGSGSGSGWGSGSALGLG